jgi:hypothetical protein
MKIVDVTDKVNEKIKDIPAMELTQKLPGILAEMATKETEGSGRRFGEEKPVQRNVENYEDYVNRSPKESNANRWAASVKEDVVKSQKTDVKRLVKGVAGKAKEGSTEAQEAFARKQMKAAAVRGGLRTASRLAYLGGAAAVGAKTGQKLVELNEAAERGRERRRNQEEYEKELDRAEDIGRREDAIGLARGGAVAKKMAKGGVTKKTPTKRK